MSLIGTSPHRARDLVAFGHCLDMWLVELLSFESLHALAEQIDLIASLRRLRVQLGHHLPLPRRAARPLRFPGTALLGAVRSLGSLGQFGMFGALEWGDLGSQGRRIQQGSYVS